MRRPRQTTIDPSSLDTGSIGAQTGSFDKYLESGEADDVLTLIVQNFVDKLDEPIQTAVRMCLMQGISYAEAAETISALRGKRTDPKTVWRWAQKGKRSLRSMFGKAAWASEVSKIPRCDDEQDEGEGYRKGNVGGEEAPVPWIYGATIPEPVYYP